MIRVQKIQKFLSSYDINPNFFEKMFRFLVAIETTKRLRKIYLGMFARKKNAAEPFVPKS